MHESAASSSGPSGRSSRCAGPTPRVLQGQVTNDVESLAAGHGLLRGDPQPEGPDRGGHAHAARGGRASGSTRRRPLGGALRTCACTRSAGMWRSPTRPSGALLWLIGPRAGRDRRNRASDGASDPRRALPEPRMGTPASRSAPTSGIDFARRRAPEARLRAGRSGRAIVGDDAAEIVRIENGRPRYGLDMSQENLPAEAGIVDRAVSFTKGCYVGQEPVARMHYKGTRTVICAGCQPLRAGRSRSLLVAEGKAVGVVTSVGSPPPSGGSRSGSCGARSPPETRSRSARTAPRRTSWNFLSRFPETPA